MNEIIDIEPTKETVRLSDMELSEIKTLQENYQQKLFQFGQLNISRIEIDRRETELKTEWAQLQTIEKEMYQNLFKKYGQGKVDLAKGIFTKEAQTKLGENPS